MVDYLQSILDSNPDAYVDRAGRFGQRISAAICYMNRLDIFDTVKYKQEATKYNECVVL